MTTDVDLPSIMTILVPLAAGGWTLWAAIRGEMRETRKISEAGRARLYDKMDDFAKEIRQNFTPRELHEAVRNGQQQAIDELHQQLTSISERLEGRCGVNRNKIND